MNDCERIRKVIGDIAKEVVKCRKCPLYVSRIKAVPGEGDPCKGILIIGEAPGATEDKEGRPFVGAAGKLLDSLLNSIGLSRDKVFITNLVKCRPPENRDPREQEIKACSPYLMRQISVIRPFLIITLGRHSTQYIFNRISKEFKSIMKVRGKFYNIILDDFKTTLFPTLHPAAALYNPSLTRILEEDFEKLGNFIGKRGNKIEDYLF